MPMDIAVRNMFVIFILFSRNFASRAPIYPTMLSVMNASKASLGRPVLLYCLSDTESLLGSLNELPVPIKFVPASLTSLCREFYGYNSTHCGTKYETDNFIDSPLEYRLIFLLNSFSGQPKSTKKQLMQSAYERPENLIFVSTESHTRGLRAFSGADCQAVTVTEADISAPEDRYRLCKSRKKVQASQLFAEERCEGSFPKGHKFRAIMKGEGWGGSNLKPEHLALVDAYRSLNNSIEEARTGNIFSLATKRADLYIPPVQGSIFILSTVFIDAQYSPAPLCFFTAMQIVSEITFIDSWRSLILSATGIIFLYGLLAIYMNLRCRLFYRREHRQHGSRVLLFFVSTFLGRSPASSLANAPTFRGLGVAAWALGMMVLGNYVQSSITAIRSAPRAVKVVESYPELFHATSNRALTPCFDNNWFDMLRFSLNPQTVHLHVDVMAAGAKDFLRAASAVSDFSDCYRRTQARTNVALSVCSDDEVAVASQWQLVPGDPYLTGIQVSAIHIMNPLRYQHRRLLLAIAEAGLSKPHRKLMEPTSMAEEETSQQMKFYFLVYIFGCAASCVVLAFEVMAQTRFVKSFRRRLRRFR